MKAAGEEWRAHKAAQEAKNRVRFELEQQEKKAAYERKKADNANAEKERRDHAAAVQAAKVEAANAQKEAAAEKVAAVKAAVAQRSAQMKANLPWNLKQVASAQTKWNERIATAGMAAMDKTEQRTPQPPSTPRRPTTAGPRSRMLDPDFSAASEAESAIPRTRPTSARVAPNSQPHGKRFYIAPQYRRRPASARAGPAPVAPLVPTTSNSLHFAQAGDVLKRRDETAEITGEAAINKAIQWEMPFAMGVDVPALAALDTEYRAFRTNPRQHERPDAARDWCELGQLCARSSPKVAQACLLRALTLAPPKDPAHALAQVELGTLHLSMFSATSDEAEVHRAMRYLRKVVEIDNDSGVPAVIRARARLQLSAAFNRLGQHATALAHAQAADKLLEAAATPRFDIVTRAQEPVSTELFEMKAIALHNLCACNEQLGRDDAALGAAQRALWFASIAGITEEPLYDELMAVEASVSARVQEEEDQVLQHQERQVGGPAAPAFQRTRIRRKAPEGVRLTPLPVS